MKTTIYISELPLKTQDAIARELYHVFIAEGVEDASIREQVELGLDSHLCDLSDTIDIEKYLIK